MSTPNKSATDHDHDQVPLVRSFMPTATSAALTSSAGAASKPSALRSFQKACASSEAADS